MDNRENKNNYESVPVYDYTNPYPNVNQNPYPTQNPIQTSYPYTPPQTSYPYAPPQSSSYQMQPSQPYQSSPSKDSIQVLCPNCKNNVFTKVEYTRGVTAWVLFIILFLFCFPFCIFALICPPCLETHHICPFCEVELTSHS